MHLTGHIKYFAKEYTDAIKQNATSRRVSGLSGGGTKRKRRRVDGLSTDFHWASSTGVGGGWRRFRDIVRVHDQLILCCTRLPHNRAPSLSFAFSLRSHSSQIQLFWG